MKRVRVERQGALQRAPDVAVKSSSKTLASTAVLAGGAIALAQRKARPALRAFEQDGLRRQSK